MNKKIQLSDIIKYGTIFFFPLRDAFGFYIGETPIRFGELWAIFYVIFILRSHKISKKEVSIVFILGFNLFLVFLGFIVNQGQFNQEFATKYTIRNILNLIFMWGFICSSVSFSEKDIKGVMKYSFYVQFGTFVLIYGAHCYFYMSRLLGWNDILASGQVVNIFGVIIPRFLGTSSEPGYLAAFLPMLLYYFVESNVRYRYFYIAITGVMVIATFSAAVYIATVIVLYIILINNGLNRKYLFGISLVIVMCFFIYFFNHKVQGIVDKMVIEKVISMVSGNKANYSATERNLHIGNAIRIFGLNSFIQKIIGRGTGGYLYNTLHFGVGLYSYDVEEAYNLYLSTLVDRGIVGLLLLVMLFRHLCRFRIRKDKISNAIFVGILIQLFHWMITGNLWQFYFWIEIILLLGYYRWKSQEMKGHVKYE